MPDGSGGQRAVPVMTTDGRPLMDDGSDAPFRAELQRQVDRRPAALVANQPAPPAPPVADADRDFDATDEYEKYDDAALADDDLEAEAERERRQRASDENDNESIRAREIFDRVTLSGSAEEAPQDDASSGIRAAGIERRRRVARRGQRADARKLTGSASVPTRALRGSAATLEPPGEPARRVGVAVQADDASKDRAKSGRAKPKVKEEEPVAEPGQ